MMTTMGTLMTRERKSRPETETLDFEVRFAPGDEGRFSGYAAIFDEPNSFGEILKRGAFRKTLREHARRKTRPGLFWMHDPAEPIGVWSAITEDEKGLKVDGQLVLETARGLEAHALLKAGALNGLSIGFRARGSERGPNGVRVLTDVELIEISLVSLPAASKARVTKVRNHGRVDASAAAFVAAVRKAAGSLSRGN